MLQIQLFIFSWMESNEYNRIKAVLAEKKRTSKELAEYLKVKPASVSRWCTNISQPSIARLFEIAEFLDVKVCSLLVDRK